jgi:hypothetical protein
MKAVQLGMRPAGRKYKLLSFKTVRGSRSLARRSFGMTTPLMIRTAIGRNGFDNPATRMIVRRLIAAAVVVCAGAVLGSCGGVSEDGFSAYVADHWPHWAGGMPSDVPPRPGAPGYNQFIAHGQADQDVLPPAAGANAAAVPVKPVFQTAPPAAAASGEQPAPAAPIQPAAQDASAAPVAPQSASENPSVVRGGLY